jgi:hypothetical protein
MIATAYLRQRGIPNFFDVYMRNRSMPPRFNKERQAADREIYDLLTGWLNGTAFGIVRNHLDTRSGHLVWRDLVDKFLSQSRIRRQRLLSQVFAIQFCPRKESIPQFFERFRCTATKFQATGGTISNRDMVMSAIFTLHAASQLYNFDFHYYAFQDAENLHRLEQRLMEDKELQAAGRELLARTS